MASKCAAHRNIDMENKHLGMVMLHLTSSSLCNQPALHCVVMWNDQWSILCIHISYLHM